MWYDLNPFKCFETCNMAFNMVNTRKCCMYLKKIYILLLLGSVSTTVN